MSKTILEFLSFNPVYCDDIHDYFKCSLCDNVMKNACFTPCGCEFCEQCIKNYLSYGDKVCPGHQNQIGGHLLNFDTDVNVNPASNKKIGQLRVKCVKLGCEEVDTIERMSEHVKKCGGDEISCPFTDIGCVNSGNADRDELASHMLEEMVHHNRMLIKLIENMKNENILMKNEQQETNNKINELKRNFDELRRPNRELIEENVEIKVVNDEIRAENAEIRAENAEIRAENAEIKAENAEIKVANAEIKAENAEIKAENAEIRAGNAENADIKAENAEIKNEVDGIKSTNENLSKQVAESVKKLESPFNSDELKGEVERINAVNVALTDKIEQINKEIIDKNIKIWDEFELSNQFVWSIDNFTTERNQGSEIYSDEFYSHNCGYKLRMRCCTNGYDKGRGSHVSLYLEFVKGKYDDILKWPCKRRFFISIVNQNKGVQDITEEFCYERKDRICFYKPRPIQPNISYGEDEFALWSDLQNAGFLNGDKMTVKFTSKE